MKWILAAHLFFLLGWLGITLHLAMQVATLGNEETVLSRDRGEGLNERRELISRKDHLRSQLRSEARRDRLELAVRRLGLPLVYPSEPRGSGDDADLELARHLPEVP